MDQKKTQKNNNVSVYYEKFFTDDTGKHISDIFSGNGIKQINIKNFWEGIIDAFYSFDCTNYFACLHGDLRIVIATDNENDRYKFNQYFISGLDGKIIKIQPKVWFGIHNLGSSNGILINGTHGDCDGYTKLNQRIFNWYAKK